MTYQFRLQADLWILDALLTGRDPRSGRSKGEDGLVDPFDTIVGGELYYLSDGGYSRAFYPREEGPWQLASESTDDVKARWKDRDVQNVVHRLNATSAAYYQSLVDAGSRRA